MVERNCVVAIAVGAEAHEWYTKRLDECSLPFANRFAFVVPSQKDVSIKKPRKFQFLFCPRYLPVAVDFDFERFVDDFLLSRFVHGHQGLYDFD